MGHRGTQKACPGCGQEGYRDVNKVCSACRRTLTEHQELVVQLAAMKFEVYRLPSGWPYLGLSGRDTDSELQKMIRSMGKIVNKNDVEYKDGVDFFPKDHLKPGYGREINYDWNKVILMTPVVHDAIIAYDRALRVAIEEHTKREREHGKWEILHAAKDFKDIITALTQLVARAERVKPAKRGPPAGE